MGWGGYYLRRRGLLPHLESGKISLLDLAVHDYLCLRANMWVDGNSDLPPGGCLTSARALHACAPRQIQERAIRRSLEHLEVIRWIKRWVQKGQTGNYRVLVARFSVRDQSGNWYRVDAVNTRDWRHPVLVPDRDPSVIWHGADTELSTYQEEQKKERKKGSGPAKKPQGDPRFQPVVDHYYRRTRDLGIEPSFDNSDGNELNKFLSQHRGRSVEELLGWLDHAFNSTNPYGPLREGFRMREFVSHQAKYQKGPMHPVPKGSHVTAQRGPNGQESAAGERLDRFKHVGRRAS